MPAGHAPPPSACSLPRLPVLPLAYPLELSTASQLPSFFLQPVNGIVQPLMHFAFKLILKEFLSFWTDKCRINCRSYHNLLLCFCIFLVLGQFTIVSRMTGRVW